MVKVPDRRASSRVLARLRDLKRARAK